MAPVVAPPPPVNPLVGARVGEVFDASFPVTIASDGSLGTRVCKCTVNSVDTVMATANITARHADITDAVLDLPIGLVTSYVNATAMALIVFSFQGGLAASAAYVSCGVGVRCGVANLYIGSRSTALKGLPCRLRGSPRPCGFRKGAQSCSPHECISGGPSGDATADAAASLQAFLSILATCSKIENDTSLASNPRAWPSDTPAKLGAAVKAYSTWPARLRAFNTAHLRCKG